MDYLTKNFEIKAKTDDFGSISGYFSTFDRIPDSYGDVVTKGAFSETIKARKESGHPFPLCWGHDLNQIIGVVDEIGEDEKGEFMTASFFGTPLAQEKREIVKSGCVYQFSFAYEILESETVTLEDGTKANELRKVNLFEISIVPIPANSRAIMTEIKSDEKEDEKEDEKHGEESAEINETSEEQKQSNPRAEKLLDFIKTIKK